MSSRQSKNNIHAQIFPPCNQNWQRRIQSSIIVMLLCFMANSTPVHNSTHIIIQFRPIKVILHKLLHFLPSKISNTAPIYTSYIIASRTKLYGTKGVFPFYKKPSCKKYWVFDPLEQVIQRELKFELYSYNSFIISKPIKMICIAFIGAYLQFKAFFIWFNFSYLCFKTN